MQSEGILQTMCRYERTDRDTGSSDRVYTYDIPQNAAVCPDRSLRWYKGRSVPYQFHEVPAGYPEGACRLTAAFRAIKVTHLVTHFWIPEVRGIPDTS